MKVGVSLLTLVPGVVGGSETYARELTRALARVGELDYEAFVPPIAPLEGPIWRHDRHQRPSRRVGLAQAIVRRSTSGTPSAHSAST